MIAFNDEIYIYKLMKVQDKEACDVLLLAIFNSPSSFRDLFVLLSVSFLLYSTSNENMNLSATVQRIMVNRKKNRM